MLACSARLNTAVRVFAETRHHWLTALRYSLYQGRAEDASNNKGVVEIIRTAITAAIVALFTFLLLPMLGAFGQKADADELAPGVTTLRFFEHDTQQTNLDLLRSGESPGDHPSSLATYSITREERE